MGYVRARTQQGLCLLGLLIAEDGSSEGYHKRQFQPALELAGIDRHRQVKNAKNSKTEKIVWCR